MRDLRSFFEANKWLYASEGDLTEIRDRLRREIGKRKNPPWVDLGGDDEESPQQMKERMAHTSDDKAFSNNIDSLFGRWPSPTIILADSLAETESIRKAIRTQDQATGDKRVIGQIATVYGLLPGTPQVQERKLKLLADIRKMVHAKVLDVLTPDEREQINALDPPSTLQVLRPEDLPPLARWPFTEADGSVGRVVLVHPVDKGLSVWSGQDLLRLSRVLQVLHLDSENRVMQTSGSAVTSTGAAVFMCSWTTIVGYGSLLAARNRAR